MSDDYHVPVLLKETIELLNVKKGGKYIDGTLGGGGHSRAILEAGGTVLGIDCDQEAIKSARKRLSEACPTSHCQQAGAGSLGAFRWTLVKGNFNQLTKIAKEMGFEKVEGVLFDLGVSSHQLETADRGFSFNLESKLDMRMDQELKITARDLVNGLGEKELEKLFSKLGGEHHSRKVARAICRQRQLKPIETSDQLAKVILRSVSPRGRNDRTHPATRVFQALRIAVNDELNSLRSVLPQTVDLLRPGGRLVVISFHSLEDRIVKDFVKEQEQWGCFKNLTPRPLVPSQKEVDQNPRSRSAKLRAAERSN